MSDLSFAPEPAVWGEVCSEPHLCTPKSCPPDSGCFYQAARRKLQNAQVIVMNHPLFFLLLGSAEEVEARESGYIFPNDFVIFDEAHTVEEVAARHIGLTVSQAALRAQLQRLYHPRTRKGLLTALREGEAVKLVADTVGAVDSFFKTVASEADFARGRELRVRKPELAGDSLSRPLLELEDALGRIARRLEDDEISRSELLDHSRRLAAARAGLRTFLDQSDEDSVYWLEKTGYRSESISLNAAPIDLAERLRTLLFRPDHSIIMTSATLSVGGEDLAYFRQRIGADVDDVDAVQIGSPFDFERQMKLYLTRRMPDPREPGYDDALEKMIAHFLDLSGGRAFVLFTSHKTLQSLAARMEKFFAERRWRLLVQGSGLSRKQLLAEFRRADDAPAVLFGAESFWGGVDVAGEALSNVIITRLALRPAGSSADGGAARGDRRARRRSVSRIFPARGDSAAAPGRGPAHPHQAGPRHRRHPRSARALEILRARLSRRAAQVPGGNRLSLPPNCSPPRRADGAGGASTPPRPAAAACPAGTASE